MVRRLIPYAGQESIPAAGDRLARVLPLFRAGFRTDQIARRLFVMEAVVERELTAQREAERRRSARP